MACNWAKELKSELKSSQCRSKDAARVDCMQSGCVKKKEYPCRSGASCASEISSASRSVSCSCFLAVCWVWEEAVASRPTKYCMKSLLYYSKTILGLCVARRYYVVRPSRPIIRGCGSRTAVAFCSCFSQCCCFWDMAMVFDRTSCILCVYYIAT